MFLDYRVNIFFIILSISILTYVYIILKKNEFYTFAFLVGSIGFFSIGILFFRDYLESVIIFMQLKIVYLFKYIFTDLNIYIESSSIVFRSGNFFKSIVLNYECSGLIEILVYSSVILFYPIKSNFDKIKKLFIGIAVIIFANICRVFLMISFVGFIDFKFYDLAHLFIGRIIFYVIIITLYYKVLTKYHIKDYRRHSNG